MNLLQLGIGMNVRRLLSTTLLPVTTAGLAITWAGLPAPVAADGGCRLNAAGGAIQHVIYVTFDNVHFARDNPNVPSDLEQMPNLLNFIQGNGTLLANHHTPLISHTATDILTSLTGVYGDRMGQPVANSYRYFTPSGSTRPGVSFAYWTAPIFDPAGAGQTDFTPTMINEKGKVAPAPWVPYTRAGCDFGAVATANTILENTAIDIPTVFGPNSPEAAEVASNPGQAFADFVGIGVHCAQGSSVCSPANNGRPDLLPDEPGGYSGFNGLFGAKYVDPAIDFSPPTDLDGQTIQDAAGHVGFPGFDGVSATVTLSWVAHMQEAGIPVTYAYIADTHDNHGVAGNIHIAYGPGEPGYVQQLKDYDRAFGKFFDRLAADEITRENTLFVFTADEGDHFAGSAASPSGCDGVTTTCSYNPIGEVNVLLPQLLKAETGNTTPFTIHADMAPTVYVTGQPSRTDAAARQLERDMSALTAVNPYTGNTDRLRVGLADPVEEQTLHMITADPFRTPTFTLFAQPDYFLRTSATPPADCNPQSKCVFVPGPSNFTFAWNHGGIQPEIVTTWLGMVGPGVRSLGVDSSTWSDHTDIRPTIVALLGLTDDYSHQGRVLFEAFQSSAVPAGLRTNSSLVLQLARVYKQINAPVGQLGLGTLQISTRALESGSAGDDSTYADLEAKLADITLRRDGLAGQMATLLENAAFTGQPVEVGTAQDLIGSAQDLLNQVQGLVNDLSSQ